MSQRRRHSGAASLSAALQPAGGSLRQQLPCIGPLASARLAGSTLQTRLQALLFNHKGIGVTDWNMRERVANVVTAMPFAWLGFNLLLRSPPAPPPARRYGAALLGVGAAAVGYHTSAGGARPHARQIDYMSIGLASWCLVGALQPSAPARPVLAAAAGGALVAAHPLAASAAHALAAEAVFFARAAAGPPALRAAHRAHIAAGTAAAALFLAEEAFPEAPLLHAAWHCAAAAAVAGYSAVIPLK